MSQTAPRKPRCARRQRGTTFAELMLATFVVGTTLVATSSSFMGSVGVYHYFADGPHEALMLAQEIHEGALLLPWKSDEDDPALFGEEVKDLWDLDGEEFSPPRSAGYLVVSSHIDWTQEVSVYKVDMNDPSIVIENPEAYEGDTLTELKVRVFEGQQLMGEFKWWMTEPTAEEEV